MQRLIIDAIETVGLVDKGANPEADLLIFKRALNSLPKEVEDMTEQEKLVKAAAEEEARLAKTVEDEESEGLVSQIRSLIQRTVEKVTATAVEEALGGEENERQEVMKGLTDEQRETFQKKLDESEERVAKAEAVALEAVEKADAEKLSRQMVEYRKQAEDEFENLQGDVETKAEILYAINDALDEKQRDQLLEIMRAANAQVQITEEIGGTGDDETEVAGMAQVHKLANELIEARPGLTIDAAITEVITNPDHSALANTL